MRVLKPILDRLRHAPDHVRIIDDKQIWTGQDLHETALRLAGLIEQHSDEPHIGVMIPTSGGFPAATIATWLLGRTVVPLNYLLSPDELAYVIEHAELDLVISVTPMIEQFEAALGDITCLCLDQLPEAVATPRDPVERDDDHVAVLLYTSGTSGRPKGVMLTSGNLASNVDQIQRWVGFDDHDVMFGVLPQFHSFGLTALTLLPLSIGAKVVYTARFMPKRLLNLMQEHRPTVFIAIPSMYAALLYTKSATTDHFSSLRLVVSGGEPLPAAIATGFREQHNVVINEGYGLTETGPATNWCRPQDYRPHSVGMPIPEVVEIIVDDAGRPVSDGAEGEICIKGPNIMAGYYKSPQETAAVFNADGFFKTGDMGRFDADGHLYITGRIKEMLIIAGENVFPREIEEILDAHPDVISSAVIGMDDPSRGEVALGFVELIEDASFDETALRSFCRERLAQFKVPRQIRHVDQLPRNATGKIMRRMLDASTPCLPG